MTTQDVVLLLVAYICIREAFFLYSTQKLVNKLMCKSFYDYQQSLRVGKTREGMGSVKTDDELPEDLGILQNIGL